MTTSKFSVTEGSGKNIASNSFTEDAVTKELQRVVINDSTGNAVTNPSSIIAIPSSSSVLSIPVGSTIGVIQNSSVAGTYQEDNAHTTGDRGIFSLNVRNDTMSSVTSADGDYGAMAIGPSGEAIVANSPLTKWIQGQNSVMYGTSVQAIAPQGASVFTYITGVQVANNSGTFSLVKFTGGLGSVLGYTVAPANGGSNVMLLNAWKTGENSGVSASINGVSSVYISMQGFTSKS